MPHQVVEKPKYMWLSGLDLLQVDDSVHLPVDASRFINVGERCNVAGSRKFLRLINEKVMRKPSALPANRWLMEQPWWM